MAKIHVDFSTLPSNEPDLSKPTRYELWVTERGDMWRLEDMHPTHIYNCIKMLSRKVLEAELQIGAPIWPSVERVVQAFVDRDALAEFIEQAQSRISDFEVELSRRKLPLQKETVKELKG